MEAFRMMEPSSFISGNAFCTENKRPFTLTLISRSKLSSVTWPMGAKLARPALANRISIWPYFFYGCIETVEVFHISDITLNTDSFAAADFLECYVDLFLAAAGDDDMRAFSNKTHGGGEAHTAVAAGDNGDFAFAYLCHGCPQSP